MRVTKCVYIINMKEYLKNYPTVPESILLFIFTTTIIGFSSHGIRNFLLNVLKIVTVSLFISFVLYIFAGLYKENSKYNIPFMFFWAAISLALTIGQF